MENVCVETECNRQVRSRGRCNTHYEYWRKANRDKVASRPSKWFDEDGSRKVCQKQGCSEPVQAQGLCLAHYSHLYYQSTRGLGKTRKNRPLKFQGLERSELKCTFPGCGKPEFNPGLCGGHYYQKLRGGDLSPLRERAECPIPGCGGTYSVKHTRTGLCGSHAPLAHKYGVSADWLVDAFKGGCSNPGCGSLDNLHIDHDHSCCPRGNGRKCGNCTRGVLCAGCNWALGNLQEDPRRIEGLLRYLETAQEAVSS